LSYVIRDKYAQAKKPLFRGMSKKWSSKGRHKAKGEYYGERGSGEVFLAIERKMKGRKTRRFMVEKWEK